MTRYICLITLLITIASLNSCKKDPVQVPFDDVFSQPYSTGIIKFQYRTTTIINGTPTTRDTLLSFTSIGNNPSEKDDYGFSKPSTPWVQLERLNPNDFQNRALIFFVGTNLNTLTLPYKFQAGDNRNAQINYVIGLRPYYDSGGNLIYGANAYAASTYSESFELTILSRVNNRLQGIFSGTIKNQDGLAIKVDKGLFDIVIVEK